MGYDNNLYVNQFGIERGEVWRIDPSPTPAPVKKNVGMQRKRLVKMSAAKSLSEHYENPTGRPFGGEDLDDRKEEEPNANQFGIESGDERHNEPSPAPIVKNDEKPRKRLLKKSATEGLSESSENPIGKAFSNEDLDDRKEEDPVKKRKSSSRKLEKDLSLKKKMKVLPKQNLF